MPMHAFRVVGLSRVALTFQIRIQLLMSCDLHFSEPCLAIDFLCLAFVKYAPVHGLVCFG